MPLRFSVPLPGPFSYSTRIGGRRRRGGSSGCAAALLLLPFVLLSQLIGWWAWAIFGVLVVLYVIGAAKGNGAPARRRR